jgi:predicted NBD/HSP70 family sugar kinase
VSRPDRQGFVERIDRLVGQLGGSGLCEAHLRWGALVALEQGLPLRDSIVIREGRRRAAMETPEAREAWQRALERCRAVLPDSTMAAWIDPIELVGADGALLVLAAPTRIRTWVERHYSSLLGEAVRQTERFAGVRFASVTLPVPMREVYAAA